MTGQFPQFPFKMSKGEGCGEGDFIPLSAVAVKMPFENEFCRLKFVWKTHKYQRCVCMHACMHVYAHACMHAEDLGLHSC